MDPKPLVDPTDSQGNLPHCSKLPYCVVTVAVSDSDQCLADAFGRELYRRLTREPDNPLAVGSGIPIVINAVRNWDRAHQSLADLAEHLLVVLVAGTHPVLISPEESIERIQNLSLFNQQNHAGRMSILLAPADSRWHAEVQRLDGGVIVAESVLRYNNWDSTFDEVLLTAYQQLRGIERHSQPASSQPLASQSPHRPHLLLSDSLLESMPSLRAPNKPLYDSGPISRYFESIQASNERSWQKIPQATHRLPAVLATSQSSVNSRQQLSRREAIVALQRDWPILTLPESLRRAENLTEMMRLAASEHLRQLHFLVIAGGLSQRANLPQGTSLISRSPELVDFSSGLLRNKQSRLLLHPDPVLTPEHREMIRAAAPRVTLLTPSTLLARQAVAAGKLSTPLDGVRVGLSASGMVPSEYAAGWTELHLEDALVQIARNLLSGGATLSYGGDFEFRKHASFTPILAQLTEAYRQTVDRLDLRLEIFQPADGKLSDIPPEIVCRVRNLGLSPDLQAEAIFSADEIPSLPAGMKYSDMRKVMNSHCQARVAIGGQAQARVDDSSREGYGGRFPGIAEEVFRALQADQPVYLCGGFGGITQRLAQLMESPTDIAPFWDDTIDDGNLRFAELKFKFDRHPKRESLDLPKNLHQLASRVARVAEYLGTSDQQWLEFNGLTLDQNRALWRSTDTTLISALITQGLMKWRTLHSRAQGLLRIEAIHGDITSVTGVDLLALPVFDDVEPQGAGAAVDRVTGGLLTRTQSSPNRLIGVRSEGLDVDYLCAFSLGQVDEARANLISRIRTAAQDLARMCVNESFQAVALVTFGGSFQAQYEDAIRAMLGGLQSFPRDCVIKWFEFQPQRYNELIEVLREDDRVELSTVVNTASQSPASPKSYPWFSLTVNLDGEKLEVSGLPQESGGVIWTEQRTLTAEVLNALSVGVGHRNRSTPGLETLAERGRALATLLFGDQVESFRQALQKSPLAITHNAAASKIPFELLRFSDQLPDDTPALSTGIHRWLKVSGNLSSALNSRPRLSHILRVGLIIDPTGDLAGARREGHAVAKVLGSFSDKIRLVALGDQHLPATKERVLDMLAQVDVMHYCGHANFNENQRDQSALLLAESQRLTAGELQSLTLVPRVVIFNACEAGRVRAVSGRSTGAGHSERSTADQGNHHPEQHLSYSLAEVILRTGVEAFIGTYWEVDDAAAEMFAASLYRALTEGQTLRDSLIQARRHLAHKDQRDWANYILYGDGRFRLG